VTPEEKWEELIKADWWKKPKKEKKKNEDTDEELIRKWFKKNGIDRTLDRIEAEISEPNKKKYMKLAWGRIYRILWRAQ